MKITHFGKSIRQARDATGETLKTMSDGLGRSIAFLSAVETGRTKIPMPFVESIIEYFEGKHNFKFNENLKGLAILDNKNAPISDSLPLQQQMLIAGFASSDFDSETLKRFSDLLAEINRAPTNVKKDQE